MGNTTKGWACGIIAAAAYGTNPLFSLHLLGAGLDVQSILFYRFAMAALLLGLFIVARGKSLIVSRRVILPLILGGVVFGMSSHMLYVSFLYMDAGIASSILFVYPILVAVIMALFFHERASILTYSCIALALAGIAMLYKGDGDTTLNTTGMVCVIISSLCYALYIVGVDHSSLSTVPSARLTFWMLVVGTCMFFVMAGCGTKLHLPGTSPFIWANIIGIAVVPTVVPILFINVSIKIIGPTYSAIVGALEPVTAIVIGVTVFGEALTVRVVLGALMIFIAVTVIAARSVLKKVFKTGPKSLPSH